MSHVRGTCDADFEEVQHLLQGFIDSGEEVGASITVLRDDKPMVNIWGGYTDESRTKLWEQDTITNVYSTTKNITSLAALMLVDRGLLDVDANVSHYWPEFAANGKEEIKVRHLLSHTSGVAGWEEKMTVEHLYDFPKAVARLEKQAPWWTPGTASGYHALTMGFLVGELVRRVSGKSLKDFVADEIAGPLHADFHIGVPEQHLSRVSDLVPYPQPSKMPDIDTESLFWKVMGNPALMPTVANTEQWRAAELGAANGHGNSYSIARILSCITQGGVVDGTRLLSPRTIDQIFREQACGNDLVVGAKFRFGIGYGITVDGDTDVSDWIPTGRVCYWGGWGGSQTIMDLDRGITIVYVMNKMDVALLGPTRCKAYIKAIYDAVDRSKARGQL